MKEKAKKKQNLHNKFVLVQSHTKTSKSQAGQDTEKQHENDTATQKLEPSDPHLWVNLKRHAKTHDSVNRKAKNMTLIAFIDEKTSKYNDKNELLPLTSCKIKLKPPGFDASNPRLVVFQIFDASSPRARGIDASK